MSISQLRSMLSDDEWENLEESLETACEGLSIIRELSGSEADEIRKLWDALHIAESYLDDIRDIEDDDDSEGDDDD